jgi:uncharacterized GH25 family protein
MRKLCPVIVALLVCSTSAWSHDTWLLPSSAAAKAGETLSFAFTSGMDFPKPESAPAADRIAVTGFRLAGRTQPLQVEGARDGALALRAPAAGDGIAVAWVATHPRSIELKADDVRHYLEEIGALDTIGKQWEKSGRAQWRESYVKLAKTYVRVGQPASDASWSTPVGLALELVPELDPTRLVRGDTLRLRLLRQGRPLPKASVGAPARGSPASPSSSPPPCPGPTGRASSRR